MFELCINKTRVAPAGVAAETTLLEYLRERARLPGTKEGCASGDCGACTVVVGRLLEPTDGSAKHGMLIDYHAINSCITPLAALHGMQILTVDALETTAGLHPVQSALVRHHGSQCGFCTPGFVMSLVGADLAARVDDAGHARAGLQNDKPANVIAPLVAGNLCRCTGYRGILEAGLEVLSDPAASIPALAGAEDRLADINARPAPSAPVPRYHVPTDEPSLLRLLAAREPGTRIVAGGSDLWLEVTQQYSQFAHVIDISRIPALQTIDVRPDRIIIGSAVTHERLLGFFDPLDPRGEFGCRAITDMLMRFASPQVRHRGTLGGNLANGSPIADWPPVLLALEADAEIGHADGTITVIPLEQFWLGYRRTRLGDGDYLRAVHLPRIQDWSTLHVHKISKRHEDDISSVLVASRLETAQGRVVHARIACGGVAATPVRLRSVEAFLTGQSTDACLDEALRRTLNEKVADNITPISDVRASAAYRSAMVRTLINRALDAAAGLEAEDLHTVVPIGASRA